jgi:hypothetical protein
MEICFVLVSFLQMHLREREKHPSKAFGPVEIAPSRSPKKRKRTKSKIKNQKCIVFFLPLQNEFQRDEKHGQDQRQHHFGNQ